MADEINKKLITAEEANYLTATYSSDELPMDFGKVLTLNEISEYNLILKPTSQSYDLDQCVCYGDVQPALDTSFTPYFNALYVDDDNVYNRSYVSKNHKIGSLSSSIYTPIHMGNDEYNFIIQTLTPLSNFSDKCIRGLALILLCPPNNPTSETNTDKDMLEPCDLLSINYSIDSGNLLGGESILVQKFRDKYVPNNFMGLHNSCAECFNEEYDMVLNSSYNTIESEPGKGVVIDIGFNRNFSTYIKHIYSNFITLNLKLKYANGAVGTYTYTITLDLTNFG